MHVLIVILLILAVLLVIFTLQNTMEVSLTFFFWEISNVPLVLILICCVVFGYILSAIYFYPRIWKLRRENNQLKKRQNDIPSTEKSEIKQENDEPHPEGIKLNDEPENNFFKE